jgi:hypothetical protein
MNLYEYRRSNGTGLDKVRILTHLNHLASLYMPKCLGLFGQYMWAKANTVC